MWTEYSFLLDGFNHPNTTITRVRSGDKDHKDVPTSQSALIESYLQMLAESPFGMCLIFNIRSIHKYY